MSSSPCISYQTWQIWSVCFQFGSSFPAGIVGVGLSFGLQLENRRWGKSSLIRKTGANWHCYDFP